MLLKKTIFMLPAQLFAPLAQFLSVVIWTHLAGANTIGAVTLITGQQELIRTLLLGWWTHYALRYASQRWEDRNFLQTSNIILLGIALLQLVMAYVLLVIFVESQPSWGLVAATCAFVVLRCINQHNISVMAALGKTLDYNMLSLAGPVLGLAIGVVLLHALGDNPALPLLGYAAGETLGLLYSFTRHHFGTIQFRLDKSVLIAAYKYSGPLIISGVLAWMAANVSRYLIDHFLGIGAAGEFAVGFGLGQRAASLVGMLVTAAALPLAIRMMNEGGHTAAMRQLSQNCALLLGVMLPSLIGLYLVSADLVTFLIAKQFQQITLAIFPWTILSGGLFAFIYNYLNHYFLITENTRPTIWLDGGLAVITIASAYPLIQWFGLVGGAIAMVLSAGCVCGVLLIYLVGRRGLLFPWYDTLKIATACVIMGLAVSAGQYFAAPGLPRLLVGSISGAISYALCILALYWPYAAPRLQRLCKLKRPPL